MEVLRKAGQGRAGQQGAEAPLVQFNLTTLAGLIFDQTFFSQQLNELFVMISSQETSRYMQLKADAANSHITCYVCLQMLQRKSSLQQEGPTQKCILCNNDFCDKHKSTRLSNACEINHETYCGKEQHRRRHEPIHIFRNMEERESWIAFNGRENIAGEPTMPPETAHEV